MRPHDKEPTLFTHDFNTYGLQPCNYERFVQADHLEFSFGGDSFGGGLIYSLLTGKSTQAAVEFAVAGPLP